MKLNIAKLIFSILLAPMAMLAFGQEPEQTEQVTIVDHIQDTSGNVIVLDDDMLQLLIPGKSAQNEDKKASTGKRTVYRVQVFSDNRAERSKQEARVRESNVKRRFPDQPTYVVYSSPYWRLQVGSFLSQAEANELAAKIKRAFPSYAKETHVVRARVTITNNSAGGSR